MSVSSRLEEEAEVEVWVHGSNTKLKLVIGISRQVFEEISLEVRNLLPTTAVAYPANSDDIQFTLDLPFDRALTVG